MGKVCQLKARRSHDDYVCKRSGQKCESCKWFVRKERLDAVNKRIPLESVEREMAIANSL